MQNRLYPIVLIFVNKFSSTLRKFEISGKEYDRVKRRGVVAFAIPEIVFPSNWMADVYVRNYIEFVVLRCYYLICIGIVFSIFRSRYHRNLLREQIVLKYSEE